MTIEELQILSKCLLVAAGAMAVVAVILFVRFDIRNIWGLVVKHLNEYKLVQNAGLAEPLRRERNIEENKMEMKVETLPLVTTQKMECKTEQETMLLELTKNNMYIFQDITCIHTDIRIN